MILGLGHLSLGVQWRPKRTPIFGYGPARQQLKHYIESRQLCVMNSGILHVGTSVVLRSHPSMGDRMPGIVVEGAS